MHSPPRHRVIHSPPVNLRQSQYFVIPPVSRNSNSSDVDWESQKLEDLPFFPDVDPPHPRPYIITAEVDLRPIWRHSALHHFQPEDIYIDEVFPYDVLEDILDQVLNEYSMVEIASAAWSENFHQQFNDFFPYEILEDILEQFFDYQLVEAIAIEALSEETNAQIMIDSKRHFSEERIPVRCPIHGMRYF